jgi:uncharacterized protein (TIGR03083 family)
LTAEGGWADLRPHLRAELDSYLAEVPTLDQGLPTRCTGWTVCDVTKHLATTFERFCAMLDQGRGGDMTPPFAMDEMDDWNERAVREFVGDPDASLREWGGRFIAMCDDPDELMPHQRDTIPVGLQQAFGLMDLAMHHDDCSVAAGRRHHPSAEVVEALYAVFDRIDGWEDTDGTWDGLVHDSGRV